MKKIFLLTLVILLQGCNSGFLDVKPSMQTIIPVTLEDYSLLMNDPNTFINNSAYTLNFIGSDEYYLNENHYNAFSTALPNQFQKQAYTWEKEVYNGEEVRTDWSQAYTCILQSNVVLDGLKTLQVTSKEEENQLKDLRGSALFHRAFAYYSLAQHYCDVYEEANAKEKLGLPLRKTADPTLNIQRSTIAETYDFIKSDLLAALDLLPEKRLHKNKIEPTKQAVYALLARMYMQIGDYEAVVDYAKECLRIDAELMDYNTIDRSLAVPFPIQGVENPEVILQNYVNLVTIYSHTRANIAEEFYDLYSAVDLRKEAFFTVRSGLLVFKGTYSGRSNAWFSGLGRDEVYLNLSEGLARLGEVEESLSYLNTLRRHRFGEADFVPFSTVDEDVLLDFILDERKRELFFRGSRWEDIRRLNKESRFQYTLERKIGDLTFTLEPGSPRFTWPIPPAAIRNGGYEQNSR